MIYTGITEGRSDHSVCSKLGTFRDGFDSLFQSNIFLELDWFCLAGCSENSAVNELLSEMIVSADPDKDPIEESHLVLSMLFAGILEHGLGKGPDDEGDYFLEGKPTYPQNYISIMVIITNRNYILSFVSINRGVVLLVFYLI